MNRNRFLVALAIAAALPGAVNATELVTNGGFETNGGGGQFCYNTSATGWSTPPPGSSYVFLFPSATAAQAGVDGQYGNLALWGPLNGSNNGLTNSPQGGAFVGMDGAFQVGAISQTITGLTAGQSYALSFDWAAAQQYGFTGPTTEQWVVGFGSQTQSTPVNDLASTGFSGWMHSTLDFTADGSSDVLSFTANGSPGVPPFALLDSVSMQAVPEKSSAAAMVLGVGGFGLFARRRARSKSSK